jgi:hypothetical protein
MKKISHKDTKTRRKNFLYLKKPLCLGVLVAKKWSYNEDR